MFSQLLFLKLCLNLENKQQQQQQEKEEEAQAQANNQVLYPLAYLKYANKIKKELRTKEKTATLAASQASTLTTLNISNKILAISHNLLELFLGFAY